jgi:hypothetical protein
MHAASPTAVLVVPASMFVSTPGNAIDDDDDNNDDDNDDDGRDNASDSSRYRTSSNGSSSSTPQYRRVDITPTAPSTEAGKAGGESALAAVAAAAAIDPGSTATSTATAAFDRGGVVLAKASAASNLQYCAGNDRYGSSTHVTVVVEEEVEVDTILFEAAYPGPSFRTQHGRFLGLS